MQFQLMPFAFDDSLVRIHLDENGDPWFVAKDVCRILEIENVGNVLASLDEDEKITIHNPDGNPRAGIPHQLTLISESGLYSLAFRSRKPVSKVFRKWVTADVLPTLRKTGQYNIPRPALPAAPAPMLSANLPSPPEEAMRLHPSMRQKLWQDALQTARLDNAGSDVAMHWFAYLCRMVAQRPATTFDEVRAFFIECCMPAPGHREKSGVLYEAFRKWRKHAKTPMPSIKAFGQSMNLFARSKKSSGIVYCDIALKI